MEINPTELGIIFGAVMAAIKILELLISKYFGLEKQVANDLQHKLEELKKCEVDNADKIVKAIYDMHIDVIKELKK